MVKLKSSYDFLHDQHTIQKKKKKKKKTIPDQNHVESPSTRHPKKKVETNQIIRRNHGYNHRNQSHTPP